MTRLTITELQDINAGIALSLPRKQENQFLAPAQDSKEEQRAADKKTKESRRLLHLLNLAVQQSGRA